MSGVAAAGKVLREPLLHFLLIGAVVFVLGRGWGTDVGAANIVVDRAAIDQLVGAYEGQFGVKPNLQQLKSLIDRHVDDEILYREGLALGVDRDDEIVRRRIVQKMRFLTEDRTVVAEPDKAAVREFYKANPDRYTAPATITFSHVFFSADIPGAEQRATAAMAELVKSGVPRAPDRGDAFPGPQDFTGFDPAYASREFGQSALSDRLAGLPVHAWSGPLKSGYGWHLVYVDQVQPAQRLPFEQVEARVQQDLVDDRRHRLNAGAMAALRRKYAIHIATAGGDAAIN